MPRRPRSDKADRAQAIHDDFDLLSLEDARFVLVPIAISRPAPRAVTEHVRIKALMGQSMTNDVLF